MSLLRDTKLRDQEDAQVVQALREHAGMELESVFDLVNTSASYPEAIPVLLEWLPKVRHPIIKQGIARALTVKEARPIAARSLIQEFKRLPGRESDEYGHTKWVIANALTVVADDSVYEEIVELFRDKQHGKTREMLAIALGRMKNPEAVDVLIEALQDEEVAGHAVVGLGKLKSPKALPYLEPFLQHPKSWIRQEAKMAIERINKAVAKLKRKSERGKG